jgi:hypothetical protein
MPVPIRRQIPVFAKAPFAVYGLIGRIAPKALIPAAFFNFSANGDGFSARKLARGLAHCASRE